MSGGSYNYLCAADWEDIHQKREELEEMQARLLILGYKDAAYDTRNIITTINAYKKRMSKRLEAIHEVWKAVEWADSGDWSKGDIEIAIKEYRRKQ